MASSPSVAPHELTEQYSEALREYTAEGVETTLPWAFQLGHRAVNQGLGLREMAAMHEKALLDALLLASVDNTTSIVLRASEFLAVALAPFEKRHRRLQEEHSTLSNLNLGLEQWLNATQHKLEAAQNQLREARKTDLRKNGSVLALSREMLGSLQLLKGLLGTDLNPNVRRLLDEAIENGERAARLLTDAMDLQVVPAAGPTFGTARPASGSSS